MAVTLTLKDSGSDGTNTTTTTTGSFTTTGTGNPLIICVGCPLTSASLNISGIVLNGAGTTFTNFGNASADGTVDAMSTIRYIDAPAAQTNTITITHAATASRRVWMVFEVSGHDTSSSSAWRDAASAGTTLDGTTHEHAVTSAAEDFPLLFAALRQSSSAPTLSLNGASSNVSANVLGGTSCRIYALTGTGAASVTLGGTTGSNTSSACVRLNINAAVAPVAAFSADATSGTTSTVFTFTDASTNTPTSWLWDFGDGDTSTSQNPTHTYAAGGTYTVTLTATNAGGSDAEVKTNYITIAGATSGVILPHSRARRLAAIMNGN